MRSKRLASECERDPPLGRGPVSRVKDNLVYDGGFPSLKVAPQRGYPGPNPGGRTNLTQTYDSSYSDARTTRPQNND